MAIVIIIASWVCFVIVVISLCNFMAFLFLVNKFRLCGGRHMTVTGYTSEKYNGRLDEEL